jgi:hypothetical protein
MRDELPGDSKLSFAERLEPVQELRDGTAAE